MNHVLYLFCWLAGHRVGPASVQPANAGRATILRISRCTRCGHAFEGETAIAA